MKKPAKLNKRQKAMFKGLRLNHLSNVGLASGSLHGKSVAMVCAFDALQDGSTNITPIAVLCDEKFLKAFGDNLCGPDGSPLPK